MRIVRTDVVGTLKMSLLKSPTKTCAGIDNFHMAAQGATDAFPALQLRFLSTNPWTALRSYNAALEAAQSVFKDAPAC